MKIKEALEKGYSINPEHHDFGFLCRRLREEIYELEFELGEVDNGLRGYNPPRIEGAKKECADIANFVDFIFKKLKEVVKQVD